MTEPVSLIKKLQLHSGARVLLINVPAQYAEMLTAGAEIEPVRPSEDYETAIAFCENPTEVSGFAERIVPGLPSDGTLWLGYRVSKSGEAAESDGAVWWQAMEDMGYAPARSVAIDGEWTCVGFVQGGAQQQAMDGKSAPKFYGFQLEGQRAIFSANLIRAYMLGRGPHAGAILQRRYKAKAQMNMKLPLAIDASAWVNIDDFYRAMLVVLGAPEWHGRNINALMDSIVIGDINAVRPPFEIQIVNFSRVPKGTAKEIFDGLRYLHQAVEEHELSDQIEIKIQL